MHCETYEADGGAMFPADVCSSRRWSEYDVKAQNYYAAVP